jgi:hypothetical protein
VGLLSWLIKKIGKSLGRNTSALFYTLLYREIFKEINDVTNDLNKTIEEMRLISGEASLESLKRQSSLLKFLPGEPDRVLKYFELIWAIVFGMDIEEYEYEEEIVEDYPYPIIRLKIKKCPVCGGYGDDPEDTINFNKLKKETDGMACGFIGMIEKVINYLLMTKNSEFRMKITEEKCFSKGDDILQFRMDIINIQDLKKEILSTEDIMLEEEVSKESFLDKFRDKLDIDRIEEFIDKPLDSIKETLSNLIRDKMHMDPNDFFDYFTNYEEDIFRIVGYLGIHLLNEYGGIIEKFLSNELFAKISGYLFKQLQENYKVFLPFDVINDYHDLLLEFLKDLAPQEMVEKIEGLSPLECTDLIFEGAQGAFEDLGIDFSELKENIWEELKRQKPVEDEFTVSSVTQKGKEKGTVLIQIFQELLLLINSLLSLPVRMILAREHESLKTAIESTTSGGEVLESIKLHADRIIEFLEEIRS